MEFLNVINIAVAFANQSSSGDSIGLVPFPLPAAMPTPAPQHAMSAQRWRGSGWMLWRPGSATSVASVGRLGASQLGVRLDYRPMLDAALSPVAYGRITSAMERPTAPEAAIGLSLQPVASLPANIAIERRVALGPGARDAVAVMAVGGFGPTPLAPGIEAEAYAQVGMVGLRQRDAFIDGKLSLLGPVATVPAI